MIGSMKYEYKGTPGTYLITETAFVYALHHRESDNTLCNRMYCRVYPDYGGGVGENEAQATATLFAASPLLLSALIKAVEEEDNRSKDSQMYLVPGWYYEAKEAIEAALNLKTVQP